MKISTLLNKNFRYLLNPHYSICSVSSHYSSPPCNFYSSSNCLLVSPTANIISSLPISSQSAYSFISSTGSSLPCSITYPSLHYWYLCGYRSLSSYFLNESSVCSTEYPCGQYSKFLALNECKVRCNGSTSTVLYNFLFKSGISGCFRRYSASSLDFSQYGKTENNRLRRRATPKQVWKIIDLIRSGEDYLESKLESLNVELSVASVTMVFLVLNSEKVSLFRFFLWIRRWQPELECKSDICSLIIDNCGHLEDYNTMECLLCDFRLNQFYLTKKAFGFLIVANVDEDLMKKSTQRVVDVLCKVGGSCYESGFHSLVEVFSVLGSFNMARFVIEKTERKRHYYNILIREMCLRCDFKGARDLLDEMRNEGCGQSVQNYDYLIGTSNEVLEIIDLVRSNEDNLESKLESLNVRLSVAVVTKIFLVLNLEKIPGLRFFCWIRHWQPELACKDDICNLVVDNCGHLDDYYGMRHLLNDFTLSTFRLTKKAFGFLLAMTMDEGLLRKSIDSVVDVLHEVGGSCYESGFSSLIEMFSVLGSFDLAKYVMKRTEVKRSYYNILVGEMCVKGYFKGVRDILEEMRKEGCGPSVQNYNYLISSLLNEDKNADAMEVFQEMQDKDCPPDALTFEILVCKYCKIGEFNIAAQFMDAMVFRGIQPRLSTHAAFIKGFFNLQRYKEAHKYVVGLDAKCASSENYSLLANLHQENGNLVAAQNILSEMMKQGLRPNFGVYMRVWKHLQKSGRKTLAMDLQKQFQQLGFIS